MSNQCGCFPVCYHQPHPPKENRTMQQIEFEQFLELFGPCLLADMNDTELLGMYHWEDMDELLEYMESHGYNDANHVWTIVDGDYGQYILQGWHRVNRTGMYILTTKPHNFEHNDKEFVWWKDEEGEEQ